MHCEQICTAWHCKRTRRRLHGSSSYAKWAKASKEAPMGGGRGGGTTSNFMNTICEFGVTIASRATPNICYISKFASDGASECPKDSQFTNLLQVDPMILSKLQVAVFSSLHCPCPHCLWHCCPLKKTTFACLILALLVTGERQGAIWGTPWRILEVVIGTSRISAGTLLHAFKYLLTVVKGCKPAITSPM